jgi:hypothetical protein
MAVLHGEVGVERGIARTIYDTAMADDEVVGLGMKGWDEGSEKKEYREGYTSPQRSKTGAAIPCPSGTRRLKRRC